MKKGSRYLIATVVLALSLAVVGCQGGPEPSGNPTVSIEPSSIEPSSSISSRPSAPTMMPNFIGRTYDEAHAELAALNVIITRRTQVTTSKPGTVVSQDPAAGAPFQQSVTLTVSIEPSTVPDVVGMQFSDAETKLTELGLTAIDVPELDEHRPDGLVIKQDPPSGTKNAAEVRLTVIRSPVVVYLADLQPVTAEPDLDTSPGSANGDDYAHALGIRWRSSSPGAVEYNLSRDYRRLVADVTLSDGSPQDARFKLEVYGDRRLLLAKTIEFGKTLPISVDVTKVLRLRIVVSAHDTRDQPSILVLGDARLQGLESEVPTPSPSPT